MAPRGKSSTLSIVIAGDNKGARQAMAGTEQGAKTLGQTAQRVAVSMGAMLAGGAVIRFGRQAIDTYRSVGAEMLQLQRITGASEEFVSGLWVAAQQSGVGMDKLATGIGILSSKLDSKVMQEWGIRTKEASGETRAFEEILGDLMDRYSELAGQDRTEFARDLFGRGGADLMKLLGRGREEMAGFVEEARKLGIALDADTLKQATQNQRDFELALTASKAVIGKELLPAVTQLTSNLANNMPAIATAVGSVASAFNALPKPLQGALAVALALGPAVRLASVAFGPLSAGLRTIAGTRSLDGLRLGLMGVSNAGAGASNRLGAFVATAATSPAVMSAAAVGVGLLVASFMQMQAVTAAANRNIDSLVASVEDGSRSIESAFRDRLADTLAGAEGGFERSWGEDINEALKGLGISADEFFTILKAGGPELDRLTEQIQNFFFERDATGDRATKAADGVRNLRAAWEGAQEQQRNLTDAQRELGVSTEEASAAEGEYATAVRASAAASNLATSAVERRLQSIERQIAAQDRVESSEESLTNAREELADAEAAAAESSEEMVAAREAEAAAAEAVTDAVEAHQDALKGIVEAEEAVSDAKREVAERERDLNDARAEAAQRLEDLAEKARDAALAEKGAALDVRDAEEALRVAERQGKSDLELDRLRYELEVAREAASQARDEAADSARESAAAAAAGVEGSREVQDAQRALADAHDGVREAQDRVTEAKRRARDAADAIRDAERRQADAAKDTAKVASEAAERVEEAKAGVLAAQRDLIDAEAEYVTALYGTTAGIVAKRDALIDLANQIGPGSATYDQLKQFIDMLNYALYGYQGVGIPQDETRDPIRPADTDPNGPGRSRPGGRSSRAPQVVQHFYDPNPTSAARRAGQAAEDAMNRVFRRMG